LERIPNMNRKTFGGLVLCLGLCGCGTVDNLTAVSRPPLIYGGVRNDVKQAVQSTGAALRAQSPGDFAASAGTGALCALDAPLSAVADTATLPVTVSHKLRSRSE
jgi:uncharacterized protein YceK